LFRDGGSDPFYLALWTQLTGRVKGLGTVFETRRQYPVA